MKLRLICFLCAIMILLCSCLCACGKSNDPQPSEPDSTAEATTVDPEMSEYASAASEKVDDYDFSDYKIKSVESFASMISEVYCSIPALENKDKADSEYIEEFFRRYYTGIDPFSCDIEEHDGRDYAVVSAKRVYSLLYILLRVDDYKMPSKTDNGMFYSENGNAYIALYEKNDVVYRPQKTQQNENGAYITMQRASGKEDVDSFTIYLASDDMGTYITSIK